MSKPILLTTIDFASGGTKTGLVNHPPKTPSGKLLYVKALVVRMVHSITGASTSDAITQKQYASLLSLFSVRDRNGGYIGSKEPLKGTLLRALRQAVLQDSLTKGDASATNSNANATNVKETILCLPFVLPFLKKPDELCPLLSTIQQIDITWASSTLFGTGNTVNASSASYAEIYAEVQERDTLDEYARLVYHSQALSKWTGEVVNIDGKVFAFGLADLGGAASTTIGSTDFSQYDIQGNDGLSAPRQHINAGSYGQSLFGARKLSAYSLPNSGSAEVIPFMSPDDNMDLGDMPHERQVTLNLVIGAGAPALTDQDVYFAAIMAKDSASWAANVGKSPNVDVSQDNARRAILAAAPVPAKGITTGIAKGSVMERFVRKPVVAKVAAGRM